MKIILKFDNSKSEFIFLKLNKRYDLDGDFHFNTARLINHSCNPNCEVCWNRFKNYGLNLLKILKKEKNYHMIMVLVLMKILNTIHVNVIH